MVMRLGLQLVYSRSSLEDSFRHYRVIDWRARSNAISFSVSSLCPHPLGALKLNAAPSDSSPDGSDLRPGPWTAFLSEKSRRQTLQEFEGMIASYNIKSLEV